MLTKNFTKKEITVGRAPDCDISLNEPSVSRLHLVIYIIAGEVYIEDKGSANGSFLNGSEIEKNKKLRVGIADVIQLGKAKSQLKIESEYQSQEKIRKHQEPEAQRPPPPLTDTLSPVSVSNTDIIQAKEEAAKIIFAAEAEAEKNVKKIYDQAKRVKEATDEDCRQKLAEAEEQAEKLLEEFRNKGQALIQDARRLVQSMREESDQNILEETAKARQQIEGMRKQVDEYAQKVYAETKAKAIKDAEVNAQQLLAMAQKKADESLKTVQTQIENLNQKLNHKEQEVERLDQQAQELRETILSQNSDIESRRKSISVLNQTIDEHKQTQNQELSRLNELEAKLNEQKNEEKALSDSILKKMKQIDELHKTIQTINTQIAEAQNDLDKKNLLVKVEVEKHKAEIDSLLIQKKEKESELNEKMSHFEKLKQSESEVQKKLQNLKHEFDTIEKNKDVVTQAISEHGQQLERLKKDLLSTEEKRMLLQTDITSLEEKKAQIAADLESQKSNYLEAVEKTKQHLAEQEKSLLESLEKEHLNQVKKFEQKLIDQIFQEKEMIEKEILMAIELEVTKKFTIEQWKEISTNISQMIGEKIESRVSLLSQRSADGRSMPLKAQKKKDFKFFWMFLGALTSSVAIAVYPRVSSYLLNQPSPLEVMAERQAQERAEDLALRKFSPPQDDVVRETYKDSVIYTQGYVNYFKSEENKKALFDALSVYMFKTWRIDETTTLEVTAISSALVSELEARKESIHPDFIKEGLAKMEELEKEALSRMKNLLGTEVRVESYLKFEREFITNNLNNESR